MTERGPVWIKTAIYLILQKQPHLQVRGVREPFTLADGQLPHHIRITTADQTYTVTVTRVRPTRRKTGETL